MKAKIFSTFLMVWMFIAQAHADDRPLVLFFGGHGSTEANIQNWVAGATAECGGDFAFEGVPYPAGASMNRGSVESLGAKTVDQYAQALDNLMKANPNRKVIIVGHSSASALADMLAAKINNPKHAELIVLDGFHPTPALQARMGEAQCWSSEEPGMTSPNYSFMKNGCPNNFHVLPTSGCQTSMCMHFKLVNSAVDSSLEGGLSSGDKDHGYKVKGYSNLSVNLKWLTNKCSPPGVASVVHSSPVTTFAAPRAPAAAMAPLPAPPTIKPAVATPLPTAPATHQNFQLLQLTVPDSAAH